MALNVSVMSIRHRYNVRLHDTIPNQTGSDGEQCCACHRGTGSDGTGDADDLSCFHAGRHGRARIVRNNHVGRRLALLAVRQREFDSLDGVG